MFLLIPSFSTEQNHLTACYNEAVKTLQFLKSSNSKHYQNTAENDIDFTFEENEINVLIEDINDFDEKLKEGHIRWKVPAVVTITSKQVNDIIYPDRMHSKKEKCLNKN